MSRSRVSWAAMAVIVLTAVSGCARPERAPVAGLEAASPPAIPRVVYELEPPLNPPIPDRSADMQAASE